jgi:DNA-binding transcriptional regulator GbsR (MarR family)
MFTVSRTPLESRDGSGAATSAPGTDRLGAKVRQVCEAVGEFIAYWGFKAIHGRIWTLLALRREPMSQVEVADFLQVSRSLVSGAMSELVEHGLVRPLSEHRNAPYEAVVDIWPTISDVLRDREWMLIETARLALEGALEELELAGSSGAAEYDLDRTRFLLSMTEMAQAFLRLLIGIRVPRKLEGLGEWLKNSGNFIRKLRELQ